MRILIVEDEKKVAAFIKKGLEEETYAVDIATDGEEGLYLGEQNQYDLIILDLMLPKINGLDILSSLRSQNIETPILLLTAKDSVEDKVEGLNQGADDYLTKPFGLNELIARSRALIRRSKRNKKSLENSKTVIEFNHIKMFLEECRVTSFDREITLSPKEFKLLELFMKNPKRVWSRDLILEKIWEIDFIGDTKTVDVHVRWLREKLEEDPSAPKFLKTVRGFGYKFG